MTAKDLITDSIPSIKPKDTVETALSWLSEFKVQQLPVVTKGKYEGLITEDELLEVDDLSLNVSVARHVGMHSAYVYEGQHVYEVLHVMSKMRLQVLPVISEENRYRGCITWMDIVSYLDSLFALHEQGGIIVLMLPKHDYSLSKIAQIIESENAQILSSYVSNAYDSNQLYVTLKVNVENVNRLAGNFDRYDIAVVGVYGPATEGNDLQRNWESLMNYLNI